MVVGGVPPARRPPRPPLLQSSERPSEPVIGSTTKNTPTAHHHLDDTSGLATTSSLSLDTRRHGGHQAAKAKALQKCGREGQGRGKVVGESSGSKISVWRGMRGYCTYLAVPQELFERPATASVDAH